MTAEEWKRVRLSAVEQEKRPSQIVGEAIRKYLSTIEQETKA
jgi:hypothetical protein